MKYDLKHIKNSEIREAMLRVVSAKVNQKIDFTKVVDAAGKEMIYDIELKINGFEYDFGGFCQEMDIQFNEIIKRYANALIQDKYNEELLKLDKVREIIQNAADKVKRELGEPEYT